MRPEARDPLLAYRERFPILAKTNYLISNSLGAMPDEARSSLGDYLETWATRGVRAWEETWWELAATLGDELAPLIGAGPGEVVFQPNVTIAHAVIFSAFDLSGPRCRLVTDSMHFPSILYLLEQQGARGAELLVVPSGDGITVDTGRLIESIDDRTAFVNISHVLFKSAYIHDVAAITARAREVGAFTIREVGAFTIIDGYQSVSAIPVDVRTLGVDVYIGGCLKWLCGGPGAAFLWVAPEHRPSLLPRLTGWMASRRPFKFSQQLDRRDDAWRFLHGTPDIAACYAARPGLRIVNEAGIDAIRAKSVRQTTRLLKLADAHGLRSTTPREASARGGTISLDLENGYDTELPGSLMLQWRGPT